MAVDLDEDEFLPVPPEIFAAMLGPRIGAIGPECARMLSAAWEFYLNHERSVRYAPPAIHVRRFLATLAAQAGSGHADVRNEPDPAPSGTWLDTTAAASLIGCSQRHASRLTSSGALGPARKVKRRWLVRQDEVEAYASWTSQKEIPR